MLYCFIGQMGGGKTLSGVKLAHHLYSMKGWKVYSNIHLSFPYERFNKAKLHELIRDTKKLQNVIVVLDEFHTLMDSRSSMSKDNKALSYFINQTRKRNVTIIATTQSWGLVDVRFRSRVHNLIYCKNVTPPGSERTLIQVEAGEPNDDDFRAGIKQPPPPRVFVANQYFDLYDTNEIVEWDDPPEGDEEEPTEDNNDSAAHNAVAELFIRWMKATHPEIIQEFKRSAGMIGGAKA